MAVTISAIMIMTEMDPLVCMTVGEETFPGISLVEAIVLYFVRLPSVARTAISCHLSSRWAHVDQWCSI